MNTMKSLIRYSIFLLVASSIGHATIPSYFTNLGYGSFEISDKAGNVSVYEYNNLRILSKTSVSVQFTRYDCRSGVSATAIVPRTGPVVRVRAFNCYVAPFSSARDIDYVSTTERVVHRWLYFGCQLSDGAWFKGALSYNRTQKKINGVWKYTTDWWYGGKMFACRGELTGSALLGE